ncbi:hypothetical protein BGZ92_000397 [Podila epicladia]|nr:hypothetical protein BGZ92_000397 [Podila epicladia]
MSDKNKVLPEIFDIIFTHLDTTSLLNAILVCRTWHDNAWHRLWRHLHYPTLSTTFFDQLAKHGHRVQSLSLLLDSDLGSHGVETVTSLLRVIEDLLGPNRPIHKNNTTNYNVLSKLDLNIGFIAHEDAARFFPTFTNTLTDLTLSGGVYTSTLQFIVHTLPGLHALATHERSQFLDSDDDDDDDDNVQEGFTDETLTDLGKKLPQLTHWAMTGNNNVSTAGLSSFGDSCQGLTSLDLTSCMTVGRVGIESLVDKLALLTHVRLDYTHATDNILRILAAPSRAARLKVLRMAGSTLVTAFGLHHVVMACVNLEELDFSASLLSLLGVFEGPLWRCTRLTILRVGLQSRGRGRADGHVITDSERSQMFTQLGRLGRLQELNLDNVGAGLQLWEAGRAVIESLKWLETLSLQQFAYKRKDVIWLMTQLPGLRRLVLTEDEDHMDLINDLRDINKRLVVVLKEIEEDDASDNRNSDSDDDDVFFYNPHPIYDFGPATDSDSESNVVDEDDEEDSLDQSDEHDVPATFAGHFLHHIVSMESDDESVEESDEDQSQVYPEEYSAGDNSISDNHDDDDDETIHYANSTFALYRSPYMSEDSQASDSLDESDDTDGNTIGYSYSNFSAYRSFDEDDEDDEENSESDHDDVLNSSQEDSEEDSEEDEIEDSENDEEEKQEESEVEEYESRYDSDETPPPPYESDCSVGSSDQNDDDEEEKVDEEEGVVYSDESVEESDQSISEESDVDVSEEEEQEDEDEEEEEIDEEDEIEEEEDLDEENEIDDDDDDDDDDDEQDLDEEEEVEMEEEFYDEEDEIDEGDYDDEPEHEYDDEPEHENDDEPEHEYDEDPYGIDSDDGNVYNDFDDSD